MEKDPAIVSLLETLAANPADEETFHELQETCFLSNQWQDLATTYGTRARAIENDAPKEAARLYFQQGECIEKRLANGQEALTAYQKAYRLQPDNEEYFTTMLNLAESQQQWQTVVQTLQDKIRNSKEQSVKSALLVRLALCQQNQLQDSEQAKAALLQAINLDDSQQAVTILQKILQQQENWQELLSLYQLQYSRAAATTDKIDFLRRCAQICEEKLADITQAIEFYQQIVTIAPEDTQALGSLESLCSLNESWDQVIAVMQQQLELLSDEQEKIKLLTRIALIWSEKLEEMDKAIACYESALEYGNDRMILEILEETYSFREDWPNLCRIYQKQAQQADSSEAKTIIYGTLGEIYEERLHQMEEAIYWYRQACDESPAELALLKKLQTLYLEKGDSENLLASYRRELDWPLDKSEKVAIYQKMGQLLIDNGQLPQAAEVYEEMLSLYPEERTAFAELKQLYTCLQQHEKTFHTLVRESDQITGIGRIPLYMEIALLLQDKLKRENEAINYYQKILELDRDNIKVLEILKSYYARQNSYQALIDTIRKISEVKRFAFVDCYLEIAQIQREKRKDIPAAIASYREILKVDPHYLEVWKELQQLYKQQQQWNDYIAASDKLLDLIPGNDERIAIHYSLIELYRKRKNLAKMQHHLEEILRLKPDEARVLTELKRHFQEQQRWQELVRVWHQETMVVINDAATLAEQYREIADIYRQRLDNLDKAIWYYEQARLCAPDSQEILTILAASYQQQQNFTRLAEVLQCQAKLLPVSEASEKRFAAAQIYQEQLQQPQPALALYERVLQDCPSHRQALERVEGIYRDRNDNEALAAFYDRCTRMLTVSDQVVPLHFKAGRFGEEYLENIDYSVRHYKSILRLQPTHEEAAERLIELYRVEQRWADLCEIYQHRLQNVQSQEETLALLYDQATIYHTYLEMPLRAIACYRKILAIDPGNLKAIVALEQLCREKEQWRDLIATLRARLKLAPKNRQKILLEAGKICQRHLSALAEAIAFYEEVVQIDSSNVESWQALHELYRLTNDFRGRITAIEKLVEFSGEEAQKIALFFEMAEIFERRLLEPQAAIDALERILSIAPDNLDAFEALARLHRDRSDEKSLLGVWERQVYVAPAATQKNLLLQMGLLLQKNEESERAIAVLRQALELDPQYQAAREALVSIYRHQENWEALINIYEEELHQCKDLERTNWLYATLGQIWQRAGKIEEALECIVRNWKMIREPGNHPNYGRDL